MIKIICVCGARPNFMKVAPIVHELAKQPSVQSLLVHTGQHYDEKMSRLFFEELAIPKPDLNLEVGSGSHSVQTARVMERFEPVCLEHRPDWVVVVGDVNSTLACSLVAVKLGIKVAHVEAGLRSFDRDMPEEINRVLTDSISDLLFVTEPSGVENLLREGVAADRIHQVGNVMIDTLLANRARADQSRILDELSVKKRNYAVVTLHRPSNVDRADVFRRILMALTTIAKDLPVIFPIHPRSRENLRTMNLLGEVETVANLRLIEPLGYLDFLKLTADAAIVLTDSGGVQEETTILQVPCLTLRENTERPITLTEGTNRLTGAATSSILSAYREWRRNPRRPTRMPALWDGRAAQRIVQRLMEATAPSGKPAEREYNPDRTTTGGTVQRGLAVISQRRGLTSSDRTTRRSEQGRPT